MSCNGCFVLTDVRVVSMLFLFVILLLRRVILFGGVIVGEVMVVGRLKLMICVLWCVMRVVVVVLRLDVVLVIRVVDLESCICMILLGWLICVVCVFSNVLFGLDIVRNMMIFEKVEFFCFFY